MMILMQVKLGGVRDLALANQMSLGRGYPQTFLQQCILPAVCNVRDLVRGFFALCLSEVQSDAAGEFFR